MTYCIGWKNSTTVFLAADAAVTSTHPLKTTESSFGEQHTRKGRVYIQEGAVKVIPMRNAALSFTGDVETGVKIAETLADLLESGETQTLAFRNAVRSHTPFSPKREVDLIFASHVQGEPYLSSFNNKRIPQFSDHENIVQFGSISQTYKNKSEDFLRMYMKVGVESRLLLVGILGLVQSYGINNYIIKEGVGGTFSSIYIDASGVHWQPDILFALHAPSRSEGRDFKLVSSVIRDDVLVVSSMISGDTRGFTYPRQESDEEFKQRVAQAAEKAFGVLDSGRYDCVVFLNRQYSVGVVVEMQRQLEHKELIINPTKTKQGKLSIGLSPSLQEKISTPAPPGETHLPESTLFYFAPYKPLTSDRKVSRTLIVSPVRAN